MIAPAADLPPVATIAAADSIRQTTPTRFSASEDPKDGIKTSFTFRKHFLQIEPGRLNLRLVSSPEVEVDPTAQECEVLHWGVRVPTDKVDQIPSAMARRFLELFSKADQGRLEEHEEAQWVQVLGLVDFQEFCIARAQPHYMEGFVVSTHPDKVRVEWHDGHRENIPQPTARALAHLSAGDFFGAWVKLGRDNAPVSLENVCLLPSPVA